MSPKTIRIIIALFLFVHAIGHIQGIVASLNVVKFERWNAHSWLLDGLMGESVARKVAVILFTVTVLGFLAAAFSFLGIGLPHEYWRTLAIVFAIPSLFSLVLYWNALAMFFNKAGCIAVNGWILIGLMILNYPTETQMGFS